MRSFYSGSCNRDNIINEEHLEEKEGGAWVSQKQTNKGVIPSLMGIMRKDGNESYPSH